MANSAVVIPLFSLDGHRVDRRPHRAGDWQRRSAKQELVHPVLVAVAGQVLEIEDFAHGDPDHRNHDPVPGLVRLSAFVGAHFAAPGVEAYGCDLLLVDPFAGFEAQARRITRSVGAPVMLRETVFHLAGSNNNEVAAPYLDALR